MELRVLQYFLAVTREQSISGAAEYLHLSQPTLSRQLKDMENELGKQLLIRGNRKITLTEEGMILRKRAEEIMELVQKTEKEISLSDEFIAGDVYIGAGETDAIRLIARAAKQVQTQYPNIHFHIVSGDSSDLIEKLDKGLLDFSILFSKVDTSKYDSIEIPIKDVWGVLMRRDSPLAEKRAITPEDLWDQPLILSRQASAEDSAVARWLDKDLSKLNIVATYNLVFNASLMADEGLGYVLGLDKLINVSGDSNLCFKPFFPDLEASIMMVWKKYQVFPKAAEKFLETLQDTFKKHRQYNLCIAK